jgi:predicted ATPase
MEEKPYVDWVRIRGYRCVRDVSLHLTRLHALIGPNDSGKSSILQAIQSLVGTQFWVSSARAWSSRDGVFAGTYPSAEQRNSNAERESQVASAMGQRFILRLDPDELRRAMPLIPRGRGAIWFRTEKGQGLASLYDALLSRDRAAFSAIDERFRTLFPTVRMLRLENADERSKTLGLTLLDGTDVGPDEMSEGMLYWLAFAIVEHLAPAGILLIEEPENGLHPSRISEVIRVLRDVSQRTQILIATHSPLVINELKPEEVTLVTRTSEQGTVCTPMIATKNFEQRSKVYALGELWLAYADGDHETELTAPSTEAARAG